METSGSNCAQTGEALLGTAACCQTEQKTGINTAIYPPPLREKQDVQDVFFVVFCGTLIS